MKILRLSATAFATAVLVAGYLYFFEAERWRFTVACFTRAPSIAACIREDFDFTADFFGMRFEGNMVNLIDRNVFYYGAFEKPSLFLLRDLMHAVGGDTGIFIDIGANTGHHSLFMSRYANTVHAFEPWEPVLNKFRHMLEINGIKNVTIHPYGLGEENSRKPFFRPSDKNLGTGSFLEGFNVDNTSDAALDIAKGDDAFANEKIALASIIKMDIEGYEKPALRGLRLTLITHRPFVLFEMTVARESPISIKGLTELRSLFPERYEFLVLSKKSDLATGNYILEPLDGIVRFDHPQQYDLLAYPGERKHSIAQLARGTATLRDSPPINRGGLQREFNLTGVLRPD